MGKHTRAPSGGSSPSLQRDQHAVLARLADSQTLSEQSLPRISELIERFCAFGERAFDITALVEVTPVQAAAFVHAPTPAGEASAATMHLRRSALRLLFRLAREMDLADSDPTIDLTLPARSSKGTRPLTDDEVALCRSASLQSLTSTRLAAVWALAESSCRSGELGHIRIADIDLDAGRVWLHGSPRTEARWAPLQEWGSTQIERRLRVIGGHPNRSIVYDGERGSDYHRQAASCGAISEALRRAGIGGEPDIRPASVAAWAGRQVLAATGRIDEAARRLGIRSLDRTATLIGFDWHSDRLESDA